MGNTPTLTTLQEANAPWNSGNKEIDIEVEVTQTLYKQDTIRTDDYCINGDFVDVSDTDLEKSWMNNAITIPELLAELKEYVLKDISMTGANTLKGRYLQRMLRDLDGWKVNETNVELA